MLKTLYLPEEWLLILSVQELKDRMLGVCDAVMPRVRSLLEAPQVPAHVLRFLDSCKADSMVGWLVRNLFASGAAGNHRALLGLAYYMDAAASLIAECATHNLKSAWWAEFGGGSPLGYLKSTPPPPTMADEILENSALLQNSVDLVGPIGSNSSASSVNYLFGNLGAGHIWAADRYNGDPPPQVPASLVRKPQMRQLFITPQSVPIGSSKVLRSISVDEAATICAQDDPNYALGALLYFPDIKTMLECLKLWPEKFA